MSYLEQHIFRIQGLNWADHNSPTTPKESSLTDWLTVPLTAMTYREVPSAKMKLLLNPVTYALK